MPVEREAPAPGQGCGGRADFPLPEEGLVVELKEPWLWLWSLACMSGQVPGSHLGGLPFLV